MAPPHIRPPWTWPMRLLFMACCLILFVGYCYVMVNL